MMRIDKVLFTAGLLLTMGSAIAGAAVLPGNFTALVVDVPEPGSVILLGSALLVVAGFARRKANR